MFVGASPVDIYNPSVSAMPYSVGLYLGDSLILGVENFSKGYSNGIASATAGGQSIFIRIFTGNSYNMKLAMHERTIKSAIDIGNGATTMQETDTREFISFGIGNQWITDAGITLGGDWVFYGKSTGKRKYTSENNGGPDVSTAQNAIDVLKNGINVYNFGFGLVTFTIGFTF